MSADFLLLLACAMSGAEGGEGGEQIANGKVFLGGLNYDSTEDSIKTHFEDNFGQVSASRATPMLHLPAKGWRSSRRFLMRTSCGTGPPDSHAASALSPSSTPPSLGPS